MIELIKKEKVLFIAFALAIVSMFFIAPDSQYISYIDYETLAVLFCLMCVMAGLQKSGVFLYVAQILLNKVTRTWQLFLILVLLCFFSSMFVTNDVALITFVPFTLTVLNVIGSQAKKQLVVPIVVLQTIAANLGSMLTPIGNPQNLYLYGLSGLSFGAFVLLTLPYVAVSLLMILIWSVIQSRSYVGPVQVTFTEGKKAFTWNKIHLTIFAVLFVLDLLTVAKVIPYSITLIITILALLFLDRKIFLNVDYSLLLTFIFFFVFIGNLERVSAFSQILQKIVTDSELLVSIITSQVVSNLPAALLLSRFTTNIPILIVGVNLGGLGTLIASMASLISYKFIVEEESQMKGKYFKYFTITNILFLVILVIFALFITKI